MPIDDPTTATPSEIDEELARLDIEHAEANDTLTALTARVQRLVNDGMAEYAKLAPVTNTVVGIHVVLYRSDGPPDPCPDRPRRHRVLACPQCQGQHRSRPWMP